MLSSSLVKLSTQVLSLLTTTESPSNATGSSTKSILFFDAFFISLPLIGRDASLISISPRVYFLNPPPVPDTPTVIRTLGYILPNSSATASVIGNTVLEPSTFTVPCNPFIIVSFLLHPIIVKITIDKMIDFIYFIVFPLY